PPAEPSYQQPPQPSYQPPAEPSYQQPPQPAQRSIQRPPAEKPYRAPPKTEYEAKSEKTSYDLSQLSQYQGTDNKPFTAVFIPGKPTQFKLGTPADFGSGSYTSI
ncbi:hypothetical protein BpHYR1_012815, partial [Brachionus plicatilis]